MANSGESMQSLKRLDHPKLVSLKIYFLNIYKSISFEIVLSFAFNIKRFKFHK